MDPATWTAIAIAATVVSAGVGTYSAVASAQAQKDTAKFNEDVARNQAISEQQKAAFEAQQVRRRNMLRLGEQRAAYAKSGVTIEGGNDVIYDSALQGELEALSSLYGGNTAAQYYQTKAKLIGMEGKNAARAGYLSAGSTLLGGAAKTAELKIQ